MKSFFVFSRVTHHKLLQGILKWEHVRYVTDAAHCGHFSAQLMKPMIKPAIWDTFQSDRCDDPKYPRPFDVKFTLRKSKKSGGSHSLVIDKNGHDLSTRDPASSEESSSSCSPVSSDDST